MENILYIVNVEAAIYKDNKWLIIKRSELEEHAPGKLSLVGGKVEGVSNQDYVLENTLKREILEEVGIEVLDDITYVESKSFSLANGITAVDIVFLCKYKSGIGQSMSLDEVSEVHWYTTEEIIQNDKAPSYLKESIRKADAIRTEMKL